MVNTNGLAIFVLTAGMSVCPTEQGRVERSIFGKKISKVDQIRVQQARLSRLEERIEKMRCVFWCLAFENMMHVGFATGNQAAINDNSNGD